MVANNFIKRVKKPALDIQSEHGIPAAVIIAKAALETGWGRYVPTDKYTGEYSHNLFGIKWHNSSEHEYVVIDTHEYINGERVLVKDERFRKYNNYQESIEDHKRFLKRNKRYSKLWEISDPVEFAEELQRAGYATDPEYARKLVSIMTERNLLDLAPEPIQENKEDINMLAKVTQITQILTSLPSILDGVRKLSDKIEKWVELAEQAGPEEGGGEAKRNLVLGMAGVAYKLLENFIPIPVKKDVLMNSIEKIMELWVTFKNITGRFKK